MRRFDLLIIGLITAILVAGLSAISVRTVDSGERLLLPALERNADVVARTMSGLVAEALGYGIPLRRLVGTEEVLQEALDENPAFAIAALLDPDAQPIAVSARSGVEADLLDRAALDRSMVVVEVPVEVAGQQRASILIATPNAVGEQLVRDVWLDLAVLLLVSVLVTLELLSFAFGLSTGALVKAIARRLAALARGDFRPHGRTPGTGPLADQIVAVDGEIERLRQDHDALRTAAHAAGDHEALAALDRFGKHHRLATVRTDPPASLAAVRTPIFLFYLAEEMTRPFLPATIANLARPIPGLSVEFVIALPIILFMAIVALGQPVLNGVTMRFGRGRSLRAGALMAVAGFLGVAFATDMVQLIAFRSLTAIGFATVFVAAQGYVVDRTGPQNRARGIGLFVSAIMVAMLCGPPVGGIVADRLGVSAAFVVSAVVALLAALVTAVSFADDRPTVTSLRGEGWAGFAQIGNVLSRPTLGLLLVGCAMPAKMLLIGVCFYYLPLALGSAGFDQAAIGRVLMLYGLAMVLIVPLISRISDGKGWNGRLVVIGGLLGAGAFAHLWLWPAPWGAALLVLQVGVAQAIATTPQSALVGIYARRHAPQVPESTVYAVFRLVERSGTAIGPAVVGGVWGAYGAEAALIAVAVIAGLGTILFGVAAFASSGDRDAASQDRVGETP